MNLRSLIPILLVSSLAACEGGGDPPICTAEASTPTADTLIRALVDGRQVLIQTAGSYGEAIYDTASGFVLFDRRNEAAEVWEQITLAFYGFHGTGTYPISLNGGEGYSGAVYLCESITDQYYTAQGVPGDRVTVTSYDDATGEIAGTFAFRGLGYRHGDTYVITNGTFHTLLAKQ